MIRHRSFIALLTLLMVPSMANAIDLFGRSEDYVVNRGGNEYRGHGPGKADFTNDALADEPYANTRMEALYLFDDIETCNVDGENEPCIRNKITNSPNAGNHLIIERGSYSEDENANVAVRLNSEEIYDYVDDEIKIRRFINLRRNAPLIRSQNVFNVDTCKANEEVTIEAWLKNDKADPFVYQRGPLKIVTLSGASNDNNVYLGQDYDGAAMYRAALRDGRRTLDDVDILNLDDNPIDDFQDEDNLIMLDSGDSATNTVFDANDKIQHVIFTHNNESGVGVTRLWATTALETPNIWAPTERATVVSDAGVDFSEWNEGFRLTIGNESSSYSDGGLDGDGNRIYPFFNEDRNITTEDNDWRGHVYVVAVYCKGLNDSEILGNIAGNSIFQRVRGQDDVPVTTAALKAASIYRRIAGVGAPVTAPIIAGDAANPDAPYMAELVQEYMDGSNPNGLVEAAELATNTDAFYNYTVTGMFKRMSNRAETVAVPLNDGVALAIGITRDNLDARQLLTADYYYSADPSLAAVPNNVTTDMLTSNTHFEQLEDRNYSLASVLAQVSRQQIYDGISTKDHPDPAGFLTSRAFMEAHAIAGTNRRLVEFAFRQFMCLPMEGWANASGPEDWVGPDVSRFPGGDHKKFLQTCRGCHSSMDGFRPAFAYFNFADGFVKYSDDFGGRMADDENGEDMDSMYLDPPPQNGKPGVAGKLNRNPFFYPCPNDEDPDRMCRVGKPVVDNEWTNYANLGLNTGKFGWRWDSEELEGRGIKQFGEMIARSEQFSRCMTKRVFRAVCNREPAEEEDNAIRSLASQFEGQLNYNLRRLFARVAVTRECRGSDF